MRICRRDCAPCCDRRDTRRCTPVNFPRKTKPRTKTINQVSMVEQWVVVTKDADFYHSHLLHGKPWKLLLVRTGNISTRDLTELFDRHLPTIVAAFDGSSLVELDRQAVQIVR